MDFTTFFLYFSASHILYTALYAGVRFLYVKYQSRKLKGLLKKHNIQVVKLEDLMPKDDDDKTWN